MEISNFVYVKVSSMKEQRSKIIGIARHRLSTDGDGTTTPVTSFGLSARKGGKQ